MRPFKKLLALYNVCISQQSENDKHAYRSAKVLQTNYLVLFWSLNFV